MGLAVPLVMGSFPCFFQVYSSSALQGNLDWGQSPPNDHTDKGDMVSLRSLSTFKIFVLVFSTLMCVPCYPGFSLQVKCQQHRRRHRVSSFRAVKDITEEDLGNVAITVRDKVYDKVLVNITFRELRTESPGSSHIYKQQQQAFCLSAIFLKACSKL